MSVRYAIQYVSISFKSFTDLIVQRYKDFATDYEIRLNMSSVVDLVPDETASIDIPYVLYQV